MTCVTEGVDVYPNTLLKDVSVEGGKVKLTTQDDREASVDLVVLSISGHMQFCCVCVCVCDILTVLKMQMCSVL